MHNAFYVLYLKFECQFCTGLFQTSVLMIRKYYSEVVNCKCIKMSQRIDIMHERQLC